MLKLFNEIKRTWFGSNDRMVGAQKAAPSQESIQNYLLPAVIDVWGESQAPVLQTLRQY